MIPRPPQRPHTHGSYRADLAILDLAIWRVSSLAGVRAALFASSPPSLLLAKAQDSWSPRTLQRGDLERERVERLGMEPGRRVGRVPLAWLGSDLSLSRIELGVILSLEARGAARRPLAVPLAWICEDLECSPSAASRALQRLAGRGLLLRFQPRRTRRGWRRARTLLQLPQAPPRPESAASDRNAQPSHPRSPLGGYKGAHTAHPFPYLLERLWWEWPADLRGELGAVARLLPLAVGRLGVEAVLRRSEHYRLWARIQLPLPVWLGSVIDRWEPRGRWATPREDVGIYGAPRLIPGWPVTLPQGEGRALGRPRAPQVFGASRPAPVLACEPLARPGASWLDLGGVSSLSARVLSPEKKHRAQLEAVELQRRFLVAGGLS